MVDVEERVNDYVTSFNTQEARERSIYLDMHDIRKTYKDLEINMEDVPSDDETIQLWNRQYGGYEKNKEKYSFDSVQKKLNLSITNSRNHLRFLDTFSGGGLKDLLRKMGCIDKEGLRLE